MPLTNGSLVLPISLLVTLAAQTHPSLATSGSLHMLFPVPGIPSSLLVHPTPIHASGPSSAVTSFTVWNMSAVTDFPLFIHLSWTAHHTPEVGLLLLSCPWFPHTKQTEMMGSEPAHLYGPGCIYREMPEEGSAGGANGRSPAAVICQQRPVSRVGVGRATTSPPLRLQKPSQ